MENLKGHKIEIKELFSRSNFYRVPEYQRPYSWDDENFQDLIEDLLDAEKEQEYFIGTVVLHKKEGISDIVDGQQRLTTLMILFACLRDLVVDKEFKESIQEKIIQKKNAVDGIPEKIRIEVKDREIFNELIVKENGTNIKKEINKLPEPSCRYFRAIEIFKDKLKPLSQEELQKFVQFISQNCMVIYLSTTTFDDAFKLFTIVNDRGKQLRRLDILKAKNIAPDIIKSEAVRNSLSQKWEDAEKNLGEDTFEDVLYLLRFLLLGEKPNNDLLVEFEERIFKKNLLRMGEDFIDKVCSYAFLYNDVFCDFTYFDNSELKNRLISLLFIMNSEFKASEWKACILLYLDKFNTKGFEKFLSLLEIKYLEGWVNGTNKDSRSIVFGTIIKAINQSTKTSEILASPSLITDKKEIKNLISKINNENIYGKTYCKYFLLRLELLTTEHDIEKKIEAKSIEHVLPQSPADGSEWNKWFKEDEREYWVNKLSNLVLLSKSKNSAAKNFEFQNKKKKYFEKRISDYPRSIQVLKQNDWTPKILEERQDEISQILLNDIFV